MKIKSILLLALLHGSIVTSLAQSTEEIRESLAYPLDEIGKAKSLILSYEPGKQAYLVDLASRDWLKRALSAKAREQWITETNYWNAFGPETPQKKKMLNDAFEDLKAEAHKKIPAYLPQSRMFVNKNKAEVDIVKSMMLNLSSARKIHDAGVQQASWLIAKDDYNLPTSRYKQGWLWVQMGEDHWTYPFCMLVNANVIQDYAGAGTYGDSYGNFVGAEICGCPK